MKPFPDKDIAIEVLCQLPAKSLMAFKCTAKRWNDFISDPSFLRIYDERSKGILGLFVQETESYVEKDRDLVNFLTCSETGFVVENTVLDFLPEKVVLVASSNGILCCRSCVFPRHNRDGLVLCTLTRGLDLESSQQRFALYICNPTTREWTRLRPKGDDVTIAFGLAFYPFCSSSGTVSRFKLVNVLHSGLNPNKYSFAIYSSETQDWRTAEKVCEFSACIYPTRVIFSNGRLHWLASNHHMVTFHVEKELPEVMKLPGATPDEGDRCNFGICFSESDGYFHYVCAFETELHVWVLKDYEEPAWELKHCLDLGKLSERHSSLFDVEFGDQSYAERPNVLNHMIEPLSFYDDVLYLRILTRLMSYNFETGTLINGCDIAELWTHDLSHPITIPHRISLSPLPPGYLRVRRSRGSRKRRFLEE